ncbi:hypothetical protein ElyMa_000190000 [Elysia marginata]|uniref:Uncharacterized protein n=1 Tax=Elysia marginata TaxID=1093978 RepID=A0AAV4EV00_9GAST|nr:hypothetical protein ElyMa_000190000 [Elysia marginata]
MTVRVRVLHDTSNKDRLSKMATLIDRHMTSHHFSKTSKCQSRIPALDCGPWRLSSNTVVSQGATSSRLPTAQHSEETAYTSRIAPEHDLLIIHHNLMMMTLEIMQLQRGKVCVNIQAVPLTTRQLGPQVYLLVPPTRQAK